MKKTIKYLIAIATTLLIAIAIIVSLKLRGDSNLLIARLGRENAKMTERWILDITQNRLDTAFPGLERGVNASGGEHGSTSEVFEILTAQDLYWWESVDYSTVAKVANEVESLPDIKAWVDAGISNNQQRRVELRVVGTTDRPILRLLFLCSNLPNGETRGDGFLKHMWP